VEDVAAVTKKESHCNGAGSVPIRPVRGTRGRRETLSLKPELKKKSRTRAGMCRERVRKKGLSDLGRAGERHSRQKRHNREKNAAKWRTSREGRPNLSGQTAVPSPEKRKSNTKFGGKSRSAITQRENTQRGGGRLHPKKGVLVARSRVTSPGLGRECSGSCWKGGSVHREMILLESVKPHLSLPYPQRKQLLNATSRVGESKRNQSMRRI